MVERAAARLVNRWDGEHVLVHGESRTKHHLGDDGLCGTATHETVGRLRGICGRQYAARWFKATGTLWHRIQDYSYNSARFPRRLWSLSYHSESLLCGGLFIQAGRPFIWSPLTRMVKCRLRIRT